MRNRFVKNQVKDRVRQDTCEAACCYTCAYAQTGYFSDTMHCVERDEEVGKTDICDEYMRREG